MHVRNGREPVQSRLLMRSAVWLFLLSSISLGCARTAADLAPFPCAMDGSCPKDTVCSLAGECIVPVEFESCAGFSRGSDELFCVDGVLVKDCVAQCSNCGVCETGRDCVTFDMQHGCFLNCSTTDCPSGLQCRKGGGLSLCMPAEVELEGTGTGLRADFFSDKALTTLASSGSVGPVDLNNFSVPGAGTNNVSVRLTGQLRSRFTGPHKLSINSDDGVRLWLDGAMLFDLWTDHSQTVLQSAPIQFEAGSKHAIVIEHYNGPGSERLQLTWLRPDGRSEVVPKSELFPP